MFALAPTRNKSFSGDQPIQETHIVCNIVAGVVTLVIGCAFAALWIRAIVQSASMFDLVTISIANSPLVFISDSGRFGVMNSPERTIEILVEDDNGGRAVWQFGEEALKGKPFQHREIKGHPVSVSYSDQRGRTITLIPYWSIVIPLTVTSAWLLLSKPRAKKLPIESSPDTEP